MDFYCEVCDVFIRTKSKYEHFNSSIQKELDKRKHEKINIESPDINDIDKAFHAYIIQQNKIYDSHLIKCEFELVFKDYH